MKSLKLKNSMKLTLVTSWTVSVTCWVSVVITQSLVSDITLTTVLSTVRYTADKGKTDGQPQLLCTRIQQFCSHAPYRIPHHWVHSM